MGWAQVIGKKLEWQGHPWRASASSLDLRWALPTSVGFLPSLVGCGEKEGWCAGWQGVSLVKGKVWRLAGLDSNPSSFTS